MRTAPPLLLGGLILGLAFGAQAATTPPATDQYTFVLCDGETCYADHAEFWESWSDCMVNRRQFVFDLEDKFGPTAGEVANFRCVAKADWLAALGPDLRAPVAKLPPVDESRSSPWLWDSPEKSPWHWPNK